MKKSLKNVVCLLALVAITTPSFAVITGSAHDFAADSWNTSNAGQICEVCHTPHGSTTGLSAPLWARGTYVKADYTLYTNPGTFDATTSQPTGASLLCLSCHDGTTDLDAAGTTIGTVNSAANVGENLSQSHPISFAYATSDAADDEIVAENATITALLDGGNVECSSCHDVHNAAGNAGLLQIDNSGSALCLTCHAK